MAVIAMNQFLIMGISGSGKSTVGKCLAEKLSCKFFDADDFHDEKNIAKMFRGEALTDADRQPWLEKIAQAISHEKNFVLACSALKENYRNILLDAAPNMKIIFLHGEKKLIHERLQTRKNHYFPASLLDSQLAALEAPPDAFLCDVSFSPEELVSKIISHISNKK